MNMLFRKIIISFCLLLVIDVHAEIKITEVMPSNISTISSDLYEYNGFVEFYSDDYGIDIKKWKVINIKEGILNWEVTLDSTHVIPHGYSLMFFGDKETSSKQASKVNTCFVGCVSKKLCTEEGTILFVNGKDTISMSYPKSYPHLSYYKRGYKVPSPGRRNQELITSIDNRVGLISFVGDEPGAYDKSSVKVVMSCETSDADIYYTLDGSIPTKTNGMKYNSSFVLDKTTVVRARAYRDDMLYSEILTGSFILPDEYHSTCYNVENRLPIVSISTDDVNLFDDYLGIYVVGKNGLLNGCYKKPANYNQDWARPANFEYIVDGKVVDNQETEIGVYGGCTRTYKTKSLKIKATKRTGNNRYTYNKFLPNKNIKKYKSLALRNGGNGFQYIPPRWRDMFIQSLADGLNLDKQDMQPVAFYINGQYWGMMILTERTNEDYLYHNYGLEEDEVDLIESSFSPTCGDTYRLKELLSFIDTDYKNKDYFEKLGEYIDIDEYMEYQILEQYIANTDWVTNNLKFWRSRKGGKFRWILYDTDFGLSLASSSDTDMHDFAANSRGSEMARRLYNKSMQNEDFRWCFLDKFLDRLENHYTDELIDAKFDSIKELVSYETCAFINNASFIGCPGDLNKEEQDAEYMRNFAKQRKPILVEQLKRLYGLGNDFVKVNVKAQFPGNTDVDYSFYFNDREMKSCNYYRSVYSNERVKLKVEVPTGYKIAEWYVNDTLIENNGLVYTGNELMRYAINDKLVVRVVFDEDETFNLPKLFINEVCSSNQSVVDESGATPDWIEIYNSDNVDVNIGGYIIENVSKFSSYVFPKNCQETIVPANGYLLLWADKDSEKGPLHLNFKLSASSPQTLILKVPYKGGFREIDKLTTKVHEVDESSGRYFDGSDNIVVFNNCSKKSHLNNPVPSPSLSNASLLCEHVSSNDKICMVNSVLVAAGIDCVKIKNGNSKVARVYDSLGHLKRVVEVDSNDYVLAIEKGMYVIVIDNNGYSIVVK